MYRISRAIAAIHFVLLASAASASTVGFTAIVSGNLNAPTFTLQNNSTTAQLTQFSYTIGDTTRNFDSVRTDQPDSDVTALSAFNILQGDVANGVVRVDEVILGLGGFDPTEQIVWDTDIDLDNTNTVEDFRSVFFNNGGLPNAVLTATFSTGNVLSLTMPDASNQSSYTFSASDTVAAPVPLPASAALLLGAVGGLSILRRRAIK